MNSMNDESPATDALNAIIAAHSTPRDAATTISDYLLDPAAISSPSLIENLDTLITTIATDPDDTDDAEILDALAMINPDFALIFAAANELCPLHYCDLQICADDEIAECAQYRA